MGRKPLGIDQTIQKKKSNDNYQKGKKGDSYNPHKEKDKVLLNRVLNSELGTSGQKPTTISGYFGKVNSAFWKIFKHGFTTEKVTDENGITTEHFTKLNDATTPTGSGWLIFIR